MEVFLVQYVMYITKKNGFALDEHNTVVYRLARIICKVTHVINYYWTTITRAGDWLFNKYSKSVNDYLHEFYSC